MQYCICPFLERFCDLSSSLVVGPAAASPSPPSSFFSVKISHETVRKDVNLLYNEWANHMLADFKPSWPVVLSLDSRNESNDPHLCRLSLL